MSAPRHVAIVMDGNGRWAKCRLLPRLAGHKAGSESVKAIIRACIQHEVPVLTLFAFGQENWRRPDTEVSGLMDLFMQKLASEIDELHQNQVRFRVIGEREQLSEALRARISAAEQLTQQNDRLCLNVAVSYSGRWDITQATRQLAQAAHLGEIDPQAINEEQVRSALCLSDLPEVDLFIRTSGEQRISNFLLWQLAYAELYFTDVHWPDFNEQQFQVAMNWFAERKRRFGYTQEQIEAKTHA